MKARRIAGCILGASLALAACSRTGIGFDEDEYHSHLPDAAFDPDAPPLTPDGASPTECVPSDETCNGVDDDCDGQVDELPPQACEGGGYQYCVAGTLSACPQRCETCMPGTQRVCFLSYCKYWAVQTCTADGKSFGKCREEDPPPECKHIADKQKYSAALEQCCLDNGYCCLDEFDLDKDGNDNEMLGNCEELSCEP